MKKKLSYFFFFFSRLNLTPGSPSESLHGKTIGSMRRSTPVRIARKRMLLDESEERSVHDFSVTSSAKGDIEISEVCPNGTFVKIHNKGKKVCWYLALNVYFELYENYYFNSYYNVMFFFVP